MSEKHKELHLVIGGEAGQGLVTIGELLCKILVSSGYEIVVYKSYQSRIRGGHNTFNIRVSTGKIKAPGTAIDVLVALNEETIDLHRDRMRENGLIITNAEWTERRGNYLAVPYKDLAENSKLSNVIAFGVIGALLEIKKENLKKLIDKTLGRKKPELLDENLEALDNSYKWTVENTPEDFYPIELLESDEQRLLLDGNQAIALGAIAAGLKFCSFYPMTPSTSIMLTVISHAETMNIITEQAEDEIAAVNMAIGASFTGAPAMAATSGGGFALMTEGISLAGMTETPLVIAVAQRPGPATGLPTRSEQGDLEFVLYGGHGEFPKVIMAPGTVESCYNLTLKAFHMAEKMQSPCFILTDQYLADSLRAVDPRKLDKPAPVKVGSDPGRIREEYKRYRFTDNGISARLLPGISEHLVVADSDEHTEDGHITEDLDIRIRMVEKRLKKIKAVKDDFMAPIHTGEEDPELLLVCWGSTRGPVEEAAEKLNAEGKKTAALCFEQVWPLVPAQFMPIFERSAKVVCVEGNATGQFAALLRRETGFEVDGRILRYDGRPFTVEYILENLHETFTEVAYA